VILAAVVLIRTMMVRSRPEDVPPAAKVVVHEEVLARHLHGAVRIETISHPMPTDHEAARLAELREFLARACPNVRGRLHWEEPGGNLLIPGEGSDRSLKPLLLLAHMDVAPATDDGPSPRKDARAWEKLAFESDLEATKPFIYGRG